MTTLALCFGFTLAAPLDANAPTSNELHQSVEKALPHLIAGAEGHVEKKTCFACHNQTYPLLAFVTAKSRGFTIPDKIFTEQAEHIAEFFADNIDDFRSGKGTGGAVDTAATALLTLELAGHKPDESTNAVVEYILKTQPDRDHWRSSSNRPPSEASHFTTTYLAVRAIGKWHTKDQSALAKKRIESARGWLVKSSTIDHEDKVFRLLGLKESDAAKKDVQSAAFELLATQRADGGWSQTKDMESDAYATATALYSLHVAGGLPVTHPVYQSGLKFLLKTQRPDGTWLITSRSKPFQPYYESGFPHGKNQFISATATGWATTVVGLGVESKKPSIKP